MPAQWTGELIGKMHNVKVSQSDLARKLGITNRYVCMVLNGKRAPKDAEQRFTAALDELIKEREGG